MSQIKQVNFGPDVWAKGTRGTIGAHATDKPRLLDCRLYKDGSLGPRPGWDVDLGFGAAYDVGAIAFPVGYRYGSGQFPTTYGYVIGEGSDWDFFEYGSGTVYAEGNVVTWTGGRNFMPTQLGSTEWLVGAFRLQMSGLAPASPKTFVVTDISTAIVSRFAPGFTFVCGGSVFHDSRAFFFGPMLLGSAYLNADTIYYSDPHAPGTFSSALQSFQVDGTVAGLVSVGSSLFIWTEESQWFLLQGRGNPADMTLTRLGPGRIPGYGRFPAQADQNAVFLASDKTTIVTLSSDGGMDDESLSHLGSQKVARARTPGAPYDAPSNPAVNSNLNTLLVPTGQSDDGTQGLAVGSYNSVWAEERWDWASLSREVDEDSWAVVWPILNSSEEALVVWSSATSTQQVYTRPSSLDEPQRKITTEDVSPSVTLPRLVQPGYQVRVRSVTVDVRTYTATVPTPSLAGSIADGNNHSTPLTAGPEGIFTSTTGEEESFQVEMTMPPSDFTHFADITLDFFGLVVERVLVEYETNEEPAVSV